MSRRKGANSVTGIPAGTFSSAFLIVLPALGEIPWIATALAAPIVFLFILLIEEVYQGEVVNSAFLTIVIAIMTAIYIFCGLGVFFFALTVGLFLGFIWNGALYEEGI